MKTVTAIEKREDVSPKEGKSKYGDVTFADEKNKKYPLDSETHVRAAWSYINMPKNAAKYSSADVATIKRKIKAAGKKYGIEFSDDGENKKTESALVDAQSNMDGALDNLDTEDGTKAAWEHFKAHGNKLSDENRINARAKIKRAARKHGIELKDKEEEEETAQEESAEEEAKAALVSCDLGIDLEGDTAPEIVYMPGPGRQRIHASVNGRPKTVTVEVDAAGAERLAHDLEQRLADEIRPHAGFDHQPGPASFLPQEFKWDEARGVVLKVDWTEAGKEAVSGRNYSYFSPTFLLGEEGKILGLPKTGEIGSMTNNPAFRKKEMRIAASADGTEETLTMAIAEKLAELKIITAAQAETADEELVLSAVEQMAESIQALSAANKQLESANISLRAKAAEVQKSEAHAIVQAAIDEGKIPGKDQELIDHYLEQATNNPERTRRVLAAIPLNPLLQRVIDVKVKDGKRVTAGQSNADLVQAQHLAIHEVQEAHPNLSYVDAFNKAKRDHPEVFPTEL